MKDLIARMVCTIQKEECFNGLCDDCPMEKITDILTHNNVIDLDDEFIHNPSNHWTRTTKLGDH